MNKRGLFLIIAVVLVMFSTSCYNLSNDTVTLGYYNGQVINGFIIAGPANVVVSNSGSNKGLSIEINSSIEKKLIIKRDANGIVNIDLSSINIRNNNNLVFEIQIDASSIRKVDVSGACNVRFDNNVSFALDVSDIELSGASRIRGLNISNANKLNLDLSGASYISGNVAALNYDMELSGASQVEMTITKECNEMDIELSGASDLQLATNVSGTSNLINADVSGASRMNIPDYKFKIGDINLEGASNARLWIVEHLDANVSGASSLKLKGNPTFGKMQITGGSSIETY